MSETLSTLWQHTVGWLDAALFTIGKTPVTTLGLLRVVLILLAAWALSRLVRHALARVADRWPGMNRASIYTLGRVVHYTLLALGLVIGLSTVGIDFTNLALLLGALGVGIGFGLQYMVANFVAGLIILFERHL